MDTLDVAVQAVESGLAAQANPSTDGSRLESWGTPTAISRVRNEQTMAKCLKFRQSNGQTSVPIYLEEQVLKTWATATVSTGAHRQRDGSMIPKLDAQVGGKLNPRWVETLMGLPVGWTMPSCASPATIAPMNCGCSATELSPPQQNELSLP